MKWEMGNEDEVHWRPIIGRLVAPCTLQQSVQFYLRCSLTSIVLSGESDITTASIDCCLGVEMEFVVQFRATNNDDDVWGRQQQTKQDEQAPKNNEVKAIMWVNEGNAIGIVGGEFAVGGGTMIEIATQCN